MKNREIDLSNIPLRCGKNNQIDWKRSIGKKCSFKYKDISGVVVIKKYNKGIITFEYENSLYEMRTKEFKECKFGKIVGLWGYDDMCVGYKKHNSIIEKIDIDKGIVTYKCQECGELGEMKLNPFKYSKNPCHICSGRKVKKGINDLWTTNPKLASMLENANDGYKVTARSCKKMVFICPECGDKIIKSPNQIKETHPCIKCSDNKSYGERFVRALLSNLNVDFEVEKVFNWSMLKRYDFYLPQHNTIIEVHGEQHYNGAFKSIGGRNLLQEKKNDKEKYGLALSNGISKYIVIDAQKSEFNYIKNSIENSELFKMLRINTSDFNIIPDLIATNDNVEIKKLRDMGFTIDMISKYLNISNGKVHEVLMQFDDYNKNSFGSTLESKVILINSLRIYNSIGEASKDTGVDYGSIVKCCAGEYKYAGRNKETNEVFRWIYFNDYIKMFKNCS